MSGCTQSPQAGTSHGSKAGKTPPKGVRKGAGADLSDQAQPKIRASKVGKWRALALVLVHVIVALHIAHWMMKGTTLSPLEPSEGMEFSLRGVVNAGLVFFALTIVSTLVMGRWFCGWACHVVALQDACRWMLGKVGIRPRMVNLGLLGIVPWLAFAYMFLMPIVRRLIHGDSLGVTHVHLYTSEFWKTFPSWPVALVTFAVCGFAIVYFLGAKGFCNYGCPYGAIFGITDQLAPFRIRVTDACEGCGHCTAVCSSNVKVHQEVRDFGMVVDPGCMKCLDCVSVCPKDALYVGFGAPAIVAKVRPLPASYPKARAPKVAAEPGPSFLVRTARWGVLGAFLFGTFTVLLAYNGEVSAYVNPPEWDLISAMTGLSLLVVLVFRGKARRTAEYGPWEEALLGILFLGAMLAFRGLHGAVPLLFAFGLSALFAWASVQFLRLLGRSEARIQRIVLKREGRWNAAGFVFAAVMLCAFSGFALAMREQAGLLDPGRATMARLLIPQGMMRAGADDPQEAILIFRRALLFDPASLEARRGLAAALFQAGQPGEGLREFEKVVQEHPTDADTHAQMGAALLLVPDVPRALLHLREAVRLAPDRAELRLLLADVLEALGEHAEAAAERAKAQVSSGSVPR